MGDRNKGYDRDLQTMPFQPEHLVVEVGRRVALKRGHEQEDDGDEIDDREVDVDDPPVPTYHGDAKKK